MKNKLWKWARAVPLPARTVAVLLLMIFALGSALRIYKLNSSLWLDEIATVIQFAEIPLLHIIGHYPAPNNHIFHSILVRISMALFGESEVAIRLPALLLGILSIPLIYMVAKELFGEKVGLVSAFLLSISGFHIMYSQQARGYAGLVFFSLLSLLFLLKAIKRDRKRHWLGFILATVLNIYCIPLGLIILAIEMSFFLAIFIYSSPLKTDVNVRLLKRFLLSVGTALLITLLLYLPVLSQALSWRATRAADYPPQFNLLAFKNLFSWLSLGPWQVAQRRHLCIFFLLFLTGVFASLKRYKEAILLCLLWTLSLFIAAYFLPSWPRLYIFILPLYLITISKGITSIGILLARLAKFNRLHGAAEAAVVCIITLALFGGMTIRPLWTYYSCWNPMQDWKGLARYLKEHATPRDSIYVKSGWCRECLKYYLSDAEISAEEMPEQLSEGDLHLYFVYKGGHKGWQRPQRASVRQKRGLVLRKTFLGRCPLETYVLKVPVANLSLLSKVDFEVTSIPEEWTQANYSGRVSVNIDSDICCEGTNSVKLIPQTDEVNFGLWTEFFKVEPGKAFVLLGSGRREENTGMVAMEIQFSDSNKKTSSKVLSDPLSHEVKKEWERLSKVGIVPLGAVWARIGLKIVGPVGRDKIIRFDDIKIYVEE